MFRLPFRFVLLTDAVPSAEVIHSLMRRERAKSNEWKRIVKEAFVIRLKILAIKLYETLISPADLGSTASEVNVKVKVQVNLFLSFFFFC